MGNSHFKNIVVHDKQMDLSPTIDKLRKHYAVCSNSRPKTVLLTNSQYYELHQPSPISIAPQQSIKKCRATKMNGCRCDAIVKIDGDFCRRHAKHCN